MNSYTRDEVGIELASSFFVSSAHQLHPRLSPLPSLVGGFFVWCIMKTAFFILALATILSACAGNRSDQTPTINGNNNTITINQTPSVDKASKTDIHAAGSGDVR